MFLLVARLDYKPYATHTFAPRYNIKMVSDMDSSQYLEQDSYKCLAGFLANPYELVEEHQVDLWEEASVGYLDQVFSTVECENVSDTGESRIEQEDCALFEDYEPTFDFEHITRKRKSETMSKEDNLIDKVEESSSPVSKRRTSSVFPGVCWNKRKGKWRARVSNKGKREFLGDFDTELDAAEAVRVRLEDLKPGHA